MSNLPSACDIVVIGGGILGCSIAYHLTRLGAPSVVLLERNALAAQATSRAAGLLTQARPKPAQIPLVQRTLAAIRELQDELVDPLGLRRTGSVHVAMRPASKADLDRLLRTAADFGIAAVPLDAQEGRHRIPWLNAQDALGLAWMPDDAVIDPYLLATAYARVALRRGAAIVCGVAAEGLLLEGGAVRGLDTTGGPVRARCVVDACGAWAGLLALRAGIHLPMAPVRSHYWITGPEAGYPRDMPYAILPDAKAYIRPEQGGLLLGLREARCLTMDARTLPPDLTGLCFGDTLEGWRLLLDGYPDLHPLYPAIEEAQMSKFITGLSTYTPDGQFVLGPVPHLEGYLVASGCCGSGVAASGGIGLAIAELATGRRPSFDLTPFRPERFGEVDPFASQFRERCAAARSLKLSG
jgi:sarcosine oxidase, subunit beta